VLVPPIGALDERVRGSGAGWVMTEAEWRNESLMLDRILALVAHENHAQMQAAGAIARAQPHASLQDMTNATFEVYEAACQERRRAAAPLRTFASARVRDALGYTAWTPPVAALPVIQPVPAPTGLLAYIARAAIAIRPTMIGRILFRLTPMVFVTALKSRLR
ncbi:MAG: hypothetical protein ACR2HE_04335, partial [Casimicrobiaceae bacterium]